MIRQLAAVAVTAGVAACGHASPTTETPTEAVPSTLAVQAESLPVVTPIEGTVTARRRAEVSTRIMARISRIPVDVGTHVSAGRTLIRLGGADIAANRAKAEAAVTAATAARDEAAKHAARMDTLHAQDAVAAVQRDGALLALTQAESQLALAKATLTEVETAASYATIRAPFAGAVVARYADEGDVAAPGMPLLVIEDVGPRDAMLAVSAGLAARLEPGQLIHVSAPSGLETDAPIRAVAAGADPMTRTVEVRATLPADWPTGIAVTALVPSGRALGIAIPVGAVVRRGQLTGVRVVTAAGVVIRWIRLGRTVDPGTHVQVLSGLEAGDRIAL